MHNVGWLRLYAETSVIVPIGTVKDSQQEQVGLML